MATICSVGRPTTEAVQGAERREFAHPRLPGEGHGTGCTLASAIAANLCRGASLATACSDATDYVHAALRAGYRPGRSQLLVLDLPYAQLMQRCVSRTLRRGLTGEPCCNGNRESVLRLLHHDGVVRYLHRTWRKRRARSMAPVRPCAAVPVGLTKSYSAYPGTIDAMVQWWYGHNAVGFFLTAGFLGMMYYFIPKQAERPIYSYRLSVVHFWALIFTYMWAGPHHLHYTALPDWAQSIGMIFSLVLLAPSWGGMINGIMTLSGAWHKLRDDPILKFLIVSLSFYGMSTFEGPMMSIKTVNALSHYTDWTIGHVHSGALGWVAMISIGTMYALIPKLFGREQMYSTRLIDVHFWTTTIGVVLYITSMWIAGVMQGLMWRATNADGTLTYAFIESIKSTYPYYAVRLAGGTLVLAGMFIMAYNVWKTVAGRTSTTDVPIMQPA